MAKEELIKYFGEPIKYDPDFEGPVRNRSCTDVIWLIFFLIMLGAWGGIGFYAFRQGDVGFLLAPINSLGHRCGFDSQVLDKPYLVFFDISKCLAPTVPITGCPTVQVCVSQCPSQTVFFRKDLQTSTALDVNRLKSQLVCRENISLDGVTSVAQITQLIDDVQCAPYVLKSSSVLKRCIGDFTPLACSKPEPTKVTPQIISFQSNNNKLAGANDICIKTNGRRTSKILENASVLDGFVGAVIAGWVNYFTRDSEEIGQISTLVIEDLVASRWYLLAGLFGVILFCLIYIVLLRWLVAPVVWCSLIGLLALLSFLIYLCVKQYIYYRDHPVVMQNTNNLASYVGSQFQSPTVWMVLLIILGILTIILLLVLIFLRKRIVIAIALIKEGSKAVSSIKSTFAFPVFPWVFQVAAIAYVIALIMYLMSVGTPKYSVVGLRNDTDCSCGSNVYEEYGSCEPESFNMHCRSITTNSFCKSATCHFVGMVNPSYINAIHAANLFNFFWTLFFIQGMEAMMLAATFATWYWTWDKKDVPFFTLTAGIWRSLRYHSGTVALGALIIAIVRMIRVLIEYIDKKVKKYDNAFTRCILCCCRCFFACLENFLRFVNKNAYIMCAVHGKGFCASARDALSLLMRNVVRVFVLDKVTDFLFFLSKVLLSIGVGVGTYYLQQWEQLYVWTGGERLHYYLVPSIILAIATFIVTSIFFNVYSMAVDTLFLCFLEDCERNDGSPDRPYFMSKNLMNILGKKNKFE